MIVSILLAAALLTGSPRLDRVDLLGLVDSENGGLPTGWELRAVRGKEAPAFTVRRDEVASLRVTGRGAAAFAYRRLAEPLAACDGELGWSWRVLDLPLDLDLRDAESDDSPARVYVVFGRPSMLGPARAIFYTWGNEEPPALERPAFESSRLHVVRVAGADEADGAWREQAVRPCDDYRRIWGAAPRPITVVGIGQDTDATGALATAELRSLYWQAAATGRSEAARSSGAARNSTDRRTTERLRSSPR